jgi:hypothetical protein
MQTSPATIDNEEPNRKYLKSLKVAFDDALAKHFVSNDGIQERLILYNKLHNAILTKRPGSEQKHLFDSLLILYHFHFQIDSQITLYGAFLFKCGLEKSSKIDIDVQFEETSEYDTLKTLLDIIRDSGMKSFSHALPLLNSCFEADEKRSPD